MINSVIAGLFLLHLELSYLLLMRQPLLLYGVAAVPSGREKRKRRPGGRPGLRTTPRKANEFGFGTQTAGRENWKMRPGCR